MKRRILLFLAGGILFGSASAQIVESILNFDGLYTSIPNMPQTLWATGFDPTKTDIFIPYELNVPQYRNLMVTQRYVSVPAGQKIVAGDSINYVFPTGTVLIRLVQLDTVLNNPATRINIEFQIQVRNTDTTWARLVYVFREDQTDADIVTDMDYYMRAYRLNFGSVEMPYQDTLQPGLAVTGKDLYYFRGVWDCENCHWHTSANGFITPQLNKGTQLQDLVTKGVLANVPDLAAMEAAGKITRWPPMDDPDATLDEKALSYIAGNCSHCHNDIQVRHQPGQTSQYNHWRIADTISYVDSVLGPIRPGRPDTSEIIIRMKESTMPLAEVTFPDGRAIKMIWEWTNSLKPPGVPWVNMHAAEVNEPGKKNLKGSTFQALLENQALRFSNGIDASLVKLYTLKGQEIKLHKVSDVKYMVRDQLSSGLYFVKVDGKSFPVQYFPF
jgi:hypothetical protein